MVRRGTTLAELLTAMAVTAAAMGSLVSVFVAVHQRMLRSAAEATLVSQLNTLADELEMLLGQSLVSAPFTFNGRPAVFVMAPTGVDNNGDGLIDVPNAPTATPDLHETFPSYLQTILYFSDATGSLSAPGTQLFRSVQNFGPFPHWSREGGKSRWNLVEYVSYSESLHPVRRVTFVITGAVHVRDDRPEHPGIHPEVALKSLPMAPPRDVIRRTVTRTVTLRFARQPVAP